MSPASSPSLPFFLPSSLSSSLQEPLASDHCPCAFDGINRRLKVRLRCPLLLRCELHSRSTVHTKRLNRFGHLGGKKKAGAPRKSPWPHFCLAHTVCPVLGLTLDHRTHSLSFLFSCPWTCSVVSQEMQRAGRRPKRSPFPGCRRLFPAGAAVPLRRPPFGVFTFGFLGGAFPFLSLKKATLSTR